MGSICRWLAAPPSTSKTWEDPVHELRVSTNEIAWSFQFACACRVEPTLHPLKRPRANKDRTDGYDWKFWSSEASVFVVLCMASLWNLMWFNILWEEAISYFCIFFSIHKEAKYSFLGLWSHWILAWHTKILDLLTRFLWEFQNKLHQSWCKIKTFDLHSNVTMLQRFHFYASIAWLLFKKNVFFTYVN